MRAELICGAKMPEECPACCPAYLWPKTPEARALAGAEIVKLVNLILERYEVDGDDLVELWDTAFIAYFTPRGN